MDVTELKRLGEILSNEDIDVSTPEKLASFLKGFSCISEVSVEDYVQKSVVEFKLVDQSYAVSFNQDNEGHNKKWIKELVQKKLNPFIQEGCNLSFSTFL